MNSADITAQTIIEELIDRYPKANDFFLEKGFRCIRCGEPFWGSIEKFLKSSRFTGDINLLLDELRAYLVE
jgi:hypothetical protein